MTNALFEEVCHDVAIEPILQSVTNNNLVPSANTNNGAWLYSSATQQTFVGLEDFLKTSSTRLQSNNVSSSKTSWKCLQDMSSRRPEDISWRHL